MLISTVILLISTAYIGFSEEIVFRGYLIRILSPSYSYRVTAVISAIVFTLGHSVNGGFDVFRILELFFVGLALAICYLTTRSLWMVTGIHWIWNFTWFYLGADGGSSSSKILETVINHEVAIPLNLIDAILAFGLFVLLYSFKGFHTMKA